MHEIREKINKEKFVKESDYCSSWNSYFVICPVTIKPCWQIIKEMNIRIMLFKIALA